MRDGQINSDFVHSQPTGTSAGSAGLKDESPLNQHHVNTSGPANLSQSTEKRLEEDFNLRFVKLEEEFRARQE